MSPRPKHPTSSVFVFCYTPADGWRIGLIHHPRFGKWMLPGGHVERHENPAEAAVREVTEETGLPVCLVSPPGLGEPAGTSAPSVAIPVWVVEQQVPPESREPEPHIHVDHLYLGLTEAAEAPAAAELRFAWFADGDLDELEMFPDTRVRARHLFARVADSKRLTPA